MTGARIELVAGNPLVAREWLARVADPTEAGEEYVRLLGESFRQEEDWRKGISSLMRLQPRLLGTPVWLPEAIEAEFRIRSSDPRAWQRLRPLLDSDDPTWVIVGLQVLQSRGALVRCRARGRASRVNDSATIVRSSSSRRPRWSA